MSRGLLFILIIILFIPGLHGQNFNAGVSIKFLDWVSTTSYDGDFIPSSYGYKIYKITDPSESYINFYNMISYGLTGVGGFNFKQRLFLGAETGFALRSFQYTFNYPTTKYTIQSEKANVLRITSPSFLTAGIYINPKFLGRGGIYLEGGFGWEFSLNPYKDAGTFAFELEQDLVDGFELKKGNQISYVGLSVPMGVGTIGFRYYLGTKEISGGTLIMSSLSAHATFGYPHLSVGPSQNSIERRNRRIQNRINPKKEPELSIEVKTVDGFSYYDKRLVFGNTHKAILSYYGSLSYTFEVDFIENSVAAGGGLIYQIANKELKGPYIKTGYERQFQYEVNNYVIGVGAKGKWIGEFEMILFQRPGEMVTQSRTNVGYNLKKFQVLAGLHGTLSLLGIEDFDDFNSSFITVQLRYTVPFKPW